MNDQLESAQRKRVNNYDPGRRLEKQLNRFCTSSAHGNCNSIFLSHQLGDEEDVVFYYREPIAKLIK